MNDEPGSSRRQLLGRIALGGVTPLAAAAAQSMASPGPAPMPVGPGAGGPVSVLDFMSPAEAARCRAGAIVDCTAAFVAAQKAGLPVMVPPGRYGLKGLRLVNGAVVAGAGERAVTIEQLDPAEPAIHCLSDVASGQLFNIDLGGFTVHGHPEARVAAVLIAAYGAYAVTASSFSFYARETYRALEIQAADASNVFNCRFRVVSEVARGSAVLVNSGVYNRFDLFLTQCAGMAIEDGSHGAEIRAVADSCLLFSGQRNRISAQVEEIYAPRPPSAVAIEDRGFGNTYDTASVVLTQANGMRVRHAFKAFSQTLYLNPQIIAAAGNRLHPFAPTTLPFTVIGGRSSAANKIEAEFDGSDPSRQPRTMTFVGDQRDFRSAP